MSEAAEVRPRDVLGVQTVDGKPVQQPETQAVGAFAGQPAQTRTERGQPEVECGNAVQRPVPNNVQGPPHLVPIALVQLAGPSLGAVLQVAASPCAGRRGRISGGRRHWTPEQSSAFCRSAHRNRRAGRRTAVRLSSREGNEGHRHRRSGTPARRGRVTRCAVDRRGRGHHARWRFAQALAANTCVPCVPTGRS